MRGTVPRARGLRGGLSCAKRNRRSDDRGARESAQEPAPATPPAGSASAGRGIRTTGRGAPRPGPEAAQRRRSGPRIPRPAPMASYLRIERGACIGSVRSRIAGAPLVATPAVPAAAAPGSPAPPPRLRRSRIALRPAPVAHGPTAIEEPSIASAPAAASRERRLGRAVRAPASPLLGGGSTVSSSSSRSSTIRAPASAPFGGTATRVARSTVGRGPGRGDRPRGFRSLRPGRWGRRQPTRGRRSQKPAAASSRRAPRDRSTAPALPSRARARYRTVRGRPSRHGARNFGLSLRPAAGLRNPRRSRDPRSPCPPARLWPRRTRASDSRRARLRSSGTR